MDRIIVRRTLCLRPDQPIRKPLVIPLFVVLFSKFVDRSAQRCLPDGVFPQAWLVAQACNEPALTKPSH